MPAANWKARRRARAASAQRRRPVIPQPNRQRDDREVWRTLAYFGVFCFVLALSMCSVVLRIGQRVVG